MRFKFFYLFLLTFFNYNQVAFAAHTSFSGAPIICNWKDTPISEDNLYATCSEQRPQMEQLISGCIANIRALSHTPIEINKIRREQLKLLFNEDLNSTSRFGPHWPSYKEVWQNFRLRWQQRIQDEKEIFALDADPSLGSDRCNLSTSIGLGCADTAPTDKFTFYQEKAIEGEQNINADRVIPDGIAYDLIKANLIARSFHTPTEKLILPGTANHTREDQLREIEADRRISKDMVMSSFPELRLEENLRPAIWSLTNDNGFEHRVIQAVAKIETGGAPASYTERNNIVDQMMKAEYSKKPLSREYIDLLTRLFVKGHTSFVNNLDEYYRLGKTDDKWLMKQDYLLNTIMSEAIATHQLTAQGLNISQGQEAAILQMRICANTYHSDKVDTAKTVGMTGAAIIAVATGTGSMLGVGGETAAGALGTTSTLAILGSSAFNLYDLYNTELLKRKLLSVNITKDSDVAYAHLAFTNALPMFFINTSLVFANIPVKGLSLLRKFAIQQDKIELARKLKLTQTVLEHVIMAGNIGVSYPQAKEGVIAAHDLIVDTPQEQKLRKKEASERSDVREQARSKRDDEER